MATHYIHYIRRNVYLSVPKQDEQTDDQKKKPDNRYWYSKPGEGLPGRGFERPVYHITQRKKGPSADIRKGDTIWIISQLFSKWGELPPSLDAKIVVEEVVANDNDSTKFIAGESSCWYTMADISSLLCSLKTITKAGKENQLMPTPPEEPTSPKKTPPRLGIYLESIRRLTSHSGSELEKWATEVLNTHHYFISYRMKDGTPCAYELAKALLEEGKSTRGPGTPVFWDKWSLPRRLTERGEQVEDGDLEESIINAIENASIVYGVESKLYASPGSYSEKEAQLAKQLGKYSAHRCESEPVK